MRHILVLEDEEAIRELIAINLKRGGYSVTTAASGEEALQKYESDSTIDIAVLDVMLPGIDGFTVCKRIREQNQNTGIIMLTAKTQEMDKVTSFVAGADDYVTKPFSPSELIARVDALYRRVSRGVVVQKKEELVSGPFRLNIKNRTLSKNGRLIDLTQVEFLIMRYFLENQGSALSREDILNDVWGENYFGELKIVDVNIRRLRMKVEDVPSEPKYIVTMWGYGYKWVTES